MVLLCNDFINLFRSPKKALKARVVKPEKVIKASCIMVTQATESISLPPIDIPVKLETSEHEDPIEGNFGKF